MRALFQTLLLFLLLVSLGACNGDFDYPITVKTLLTGGDVKEWQVERILDLRGGVMIDITDDCNLDDTFFFDKEGNLELRDNFNKCNSLEQTDPRISWLLDPQDQSVLYIRLFENTAPFKTIINKINEQELELEIIIDFTDRSSTIYQFKAKGLFL